MTENVIGMVDVLALLDFLGKVTTQLTCGGQFFGSFLH